MLVKEKGAGQESPKIFAGRKSCACEGTTAGEGRGGEESPGATTCCNGPLQARRTPSDPPGTQRSYTGSKGSDGPSPEQRLRHLPRTAAEQGVLVNTN